MQPYKGFKVCWNRFYRTLGKTKKGKAAWAYIAKHSLERRVAKTLIAFRCRTYKPATDLLAWAVPP